jgi:hypothetical protein
MVSKSQKWSRRGGLMAAVVLAAGCSWVSSKGNAGSPPPSSEPSVAENTPAVTDNPDKVNYAGQAWVLQALGQNGTSDYPKRHVNCVAIDVYIKLATISNRPHPAWKWKASVYIGPNLGQATFISGVNVNPPEGTVEVGQTPTLHVTGTYKGRSGDLFWVYLESIYGSGGASVDYTCS